MDPKILAELKDLASLAQSAITSLALLAGGIWALLKINIWRETQWNVIVNITADSFPYAPGMRLLIIDIGLRNIGKIYVKAGKNGCQVTIAEIPQDRNIGDILTSAMDLREWPTIKTLVEKYDIIALDSRPGRSYGLEPGCEYHEFVAVVVPQGAYVGTQIRFWGPDNDHITQRRLIYVEADS